MKFTFEAEMKKGDCYRCPCCWESTDDVFESYSSFYCNITNEPVGLRVSASECPLKEKYADRGLSKHINKGNA